MIVGIVSWVFTLKYHASDCDSSSLMVSKDIATTIHNKKRMRYHLRREWGKQDYIKVEICCISSY